VVVEAAEVEGSVDEVETELARGGDAPAAGDLDGAVDAHADLAGGAVSLVPEVEADHVRRRGISEESPVDRGELGVRDERDVDVDPGSSAVREGGADRRADGSVGKEPAANAP